MKKYIALIFLMIVLLTLFSCAKKDGELAEEQIETNDTNDTETTTEQESYDPEVVDTLTEDLEDLKW